MALSHLQEIREMIKGFQKEGITTFLSSHLLQEVSETCDSVIFLNGSKILAYDTVENIQGRMAVTTIKVKFLAPVSDEIIAKLKIMDGVSNVTRRNGDIIIGFDGKPETSNAILTQMMACGCKISSFAPEMANLEDFYVSVMSDERGVSA